MSDALVVLLVLTPVGLVSLVCSGHPAMSL